MGPLLWLTCESKILKINLLWRKVCLSAGKEKCLNAIQATLSLWTSSHTPAGILASNECIQELTLKHIGCDPQLDMPPYHC